MAKAALVALDWGTSNLRASLLDGRGQVIEQRAAAVGVMAVADGDFEPTLRRLCQDWMADASLPVVASGMIGSRQGWVEAPYLMCPATPGQAARQLRRIAMRGGGVVHIVPGLRCTGDDEQVDVMRGEETQVWGADLDAGSCCVLPGTHSKWAWVGEGAAILSFRTYMTGELYAVLQQHSILGRLMRAGAPGPLAFADGVRLGLAQHAHLPHALFSVRTSGLVGLRSAEDLPDYLSGLLIGAEIGSMRQGGAPDRVVLIGEAGLAGRYRQALELAGIRVELATADVTTRGQWRLAVAAGLVGASS